MSQFSALFQRVSLAPSQCLSIPAPPKFQFLSLPELKQLLVAFMGVPNRASESFPSTYCKCIGRRIIKLPVRPATRGTQTNNFGRCARQLNCGNCHGAARDKLDRGAAR